MAFVRSSYRNGNGECAEFADLGGAVAMREGKQQQAGAVLTSTAEGWRAFIAGAVNDELGLP